MKNKTFLLICGVILALLLMGCGGGSAATTTKQASTEAVTTAAAETTAEQTTEPATEQEETTTKKSEKSTEKSTETTTEKSKEKSTEKSTEKATEAETTTAATGELVAPTLEWWQLYNPNDFDTITGVITNPNDVSVDMDYDLVFYKDGKEVSRIEYCGNYSILPHGESLLWGNADIPAADEVDEVKLENVVVSKTNYPGIDGKYEYAGIIDGRACYDFEFESQPTLANIFFVLYNDKNDNDTLDKGEVVVTNITATAEQKGQASFDPNVYDYTDVAVFFSAY